MEILPADPAREITILRGERQRGRERCGALFSPSRSPFPVCQTAGTGAHLISMLARITDAFLPASDPPDEIADEATRPAFIAVARLAHLRAAPCNEKSRASEIPLH